MATGSTAAYLQIASLIAGAVGTGVSYYGAKQQAAAQERMVRYNQEVARQQAEMEFALMSQQAAQNAALAEAQMRAGENNAKQLELVAESNLRQNEEDIRRKRESYLRLKARQRAGISASGVDFAGSPLDALAETAGVAELAIQSMHQKGELEYRDTMRQAAITRANAGTYGIERDGFRFRGEAAKLSRRINLADAQMQFLSGMSTVKGTKRAANASLISGLGSTAGQTYSAIT